MSGRIHPLTTLQGGSGIPNYGAFLGTAASSELLASINEQVGSTFFGTYYADTTAAFVRELITPLNLTAQQIQINVENLMNPDLIRPLLTPEDFTYIPAEMQLPILLYGPVRDLYERGQVEGFGYNHDFLPEEDLYAHILARGRVDDVLGAMNKDGMVTFNWTMKSDEPELNPQQVRDIRDTRETVDHILATTSYDPTSYPNERG